MNIEYIRHKLSHDESLRVLFINDLGFQYGAGIAMYRQVQSFLLSGHEVMVLCWSKDNKIKSIPSMPHNMLGTWLGVQELPHLHVENGYSESHIIDEILKTIAPCYPDVIILGNLHGACWPLRLLLELSQLDCLVIAFMHDCYLITGRCAYPGNCSLYLTGCDETCPTADEYPFLAPEKIPAAWALRRTIFCGPHGIPIATNSLWTLQMARQALPGLRHADVVYYGLDERLFSRIDRTLARRLLEIPDDERAIILSGAADLGEVRKGGPILHELARRLANNDHVQLITFGHESFGLKNVRSAGFIEDYRKTPLLYSAADIFLGTSIEEAFGQTFIEAAACATPVVAFNVGGIGEAVHHNVSALLVNEINVDALMKEIDFFVANPETRKEFGRRGRIGVEQYYTLERQAKRWMNYLDNLLSQWDSIHDYDDSNEVLINSLPINPTKESKSIGRYIKDTDVHFIDFNLSQIEGWLTPAAAYLTSYLMNYQNEKNINGSIFEIGVFKGKYLSLLYHLSKENDYVLGVDIFQGLLKSDIESSIELVCGSSDRLILIESDSQKIHADEIVKTLCNKARVISIDGSHIASVVCNDIELSEKILDEHGFIALDDFLNPIAIGVSEGFYRYFLNNEYTLLVPFAWSGNKLFICKKDNYGLYRDLAFSFTQEYDFFEQNKDFNNRMKLSPDWVEQVLLRDKVLII